MELWDVLSNGYVEDEMRRNELRELNKKDAKVLFFLNELVTDEMNRRISYSVTAHEAWNILKNEFNGKEKLAMEKLYNFRREFENLNIKSEETIQDYFSRLSILVKEMISYGDD